MAAVLVLAGFYIEELATMRQLMDQIGGQGMRLVPATPALLHAPLHAALATPEPQWDQPVPPEWLHGGGWGQQRMVLMSGLDAEGAGVLLEIFEAAELPAICPAYATPGNRSQALGQVLAAALKEWRQAGGARPAAAAAAAEEEEASGVPFVEALPPVETVVPLEVLQPGAAQPAGAERGGAASGGPEVVQAEFSERPAAAAAGSAAGSAAGAAGGAADVPLDVIDAIATGAAPAGPALGSLAAAARAPAQASPGFDQQEVEPLLQASQGAQAVDASELTQLINQAAARAAEQAARAAQQAGVPFEPAAGEWTPPAATAARSSTGSAKPWEGGAAAAAPTNPSKGFAPPSRKAAKAARAARQRGSSRPSGGPAAKPATAPAAQGAAAPPKGSAASASDAQQGQQQGQGQQQEGGHTFPPVEQFVLSRAQLREATAQYGLDYEQLLADIQQRGITLED